MIPLKKYSDEFRDIFCTQEMYEYYTSDDGENLDFHQRTAEDICDLVNNAILNSFLRANKHYPAFVSAYSKKVDIEKDAALFAHGTTIDKKWNYIDLFGYSPVQKWIDSVDGKYSVLYLVCCNRGNHTIKSKKSAVLHPFGVYSEPFREQGHVQIELFVPGLDYVTPYNIEHDLKELEKSLADKPKHL
jgi:hypothetical protein